MMDEIMEAYERANKGGATPNLACTDEGSFYALLAEMGVSLEWAKKNANIAIEDGTVWITPIIKEDQNDKANEHLGIH